LPTTHTSLLIEKLTLVKLQDRRVVGLCYNCDEKFYPGHKCTTQFLLCLGDEGQLEDNITTSLTFANNPDPDDPTHVYLSFHALFGAPGANTFKFEGHIS